MSISSEIGWIGTGIMGAPMARRLIRAGHHLRVYNRSPEKARLLEKDGATVVHSAIEAARESAIIFTMLSDTPDVELTIANVEEALEPGQIVVDMSTIAPAAARRIADRLARHQVEFLDAPVSGGEPGAIEGTLTIMVGGRESALDGVRPLLEKLGKKITHMGPCGSGQMTKLVNQVAVALTLEATAESLLLAKKGGLDPQRVLEAIGAGAAGSWQMQNLGPKIAARDFRPGFLIRLMRKDLRLVGEAAAECRAALPALSVVNAIFQAAAALGHDEHGTQALAASLDALNAIKDADGGS
jgi:3-hydroxyisobutyrate dehydrogenase-like beta-hydroxyacid dehydrogenase